MSSATEKATPARVFGFLYHHWRRQPVLATTISTIVSVATLADVATPVFAGRLVNAVTNPSHAAASHAALAAVAWLGGLGLAAVLARQAALWGLIRFTLRIMTDIKAEAFTHVQNFSTAWHAETFSGAVTRQILRGASALDMLNDVVFFGLLPTTVMLLGATAVLGWRWPALGAAIAVGNAIYVAATIALALRWVEPAAELSNVWDTRVSASLADAITCNATVRAFGAEAREETRFGSVLAKWRRRTWRTWNRGVTSYSVQSLMLVALQLMIAGAAILLWQQSHANAGDVTTVLTLYFVLQGYLRNIGQHVRETQRGIADMHELVALSINDFSMHDRPAAPALRVHRGRIEVRDITFQYGAHDTNLFENLSLTIAGGERIGLVGPSGSGKSTFVRLIQRLHDLNGGKILIDGQNIAAVTQHSLRSQIAIVPQEPTLFHRTLAENIAYGRPDATAQEIEHAARLAHAHEFIARQPKGYATLVGERGVKLSGGERQRVAIARAFLADRPILILDEATSSLDSESEAAIAEAAARLMQGRTCLVIAHRLSTVRAMDRILVFRAGDIIEEGTHAALVARPAGLYRDLFERQALGPVTAE